MQDNLGDRMKQYEGVTDVKLIRRLPVICRVDGKAFHTLTSECKKPWDAFFTHTMQQTAFLTAKEIQGCDFVYVASDEMSFLITDYARVETEGYFGYRLQKIVSIVAASVSTIFSQLFGKRGLFDSRAFNLPLHEVVNYFIWRQQDCTRNSVSTLAQSLFSHKELHKKDSSELHEMMFTKGTNWNDTPTHLKRGAAVRFGNLDLEPPIFVQDRDYIRCVSENSDLF